jgi:hypothetical protein
MTRGLTREAIIAALEALASELPPASRPHEIIIAGGAALVLLYRARESTKDVDAVVSSGTVQAAARRVAAGLGLPEDWLNDGAKGYLHGLARGDAVLETPALVVRTLASTQLLAMKLCAWRDDLDISDARLLLSKLAGEKDVVWSQVEPFLVPGRELKARLAYDDLWEAENGPA